MAVGRVATIVQGKQVTKKVAQVGPGPKVDHRYKKGYDEWANDGDWARVKSSNVRAVRYLRREKELQVEFKGGGTYAYYGVTVTVAKEMFRTSSFGKFVHRRLKGKYDYKRIA